MAAGVAHGLLALGIGSANAVGDATAADTCTHSFRTNRGYTDARDRSTEQRCNQGHRSGHGTGSIKRGGLGWPYAPLDSRGDD